MKILVLADFSSFGGTRTFLFRLLNYYASKSWQVHLIADQAHLDVLAQEDLKGLGIGFTAVRIPSGVAARLLRRSFFWKFVEASAIRYRIRVQKPDLVVVSTGTPGAWLWSVLDNSCPFIYFLHTSPIRKLPVALRKVLTKRLTKDRRNMIVTVSHHAAEQIRRIWKLPKSVEQLRVVYNTAGPAVAGVRRMTVSRSPVVLTLGHVTNYKNPFFWIHVAAQVTRQMASAPRFIWAGAGDMRDACRREVDRQQLGDVQFVEPIADVGGLYDQATLYFQPSLMESHGISVLDAMRRGIPCVVSDRGGLTESIQHGVSGVCIDPYNVTEGARVIVELLNSPQRMDELGESARQRYCTKFSENTWEEQIKDLHRPIF